MGKKLGVDRKSLNEWEEEEELDPTDPDYCEFSPAYRLLFTWIQKLDSEATVKNLFDKLVDADVSKNLLKSFGVLVQESLSVN